MQTSEIGNTTILASLNENITCGLCRGYLIEAVSITECLHSFCKSCIVKYLENKHDCPTCGILIHQSHPLNYISFDRTLQDIVYKVVPDLKKNERLRRQQFYQSMGTSPPLSDDLVRDGLESGHSDNQPLDKSSPGVNSSSGQTSNCSSAFDPDMHRNDEQVNIQLEPGSTTLKPLGYKYLRISARATVTHLRKYVALQVLHDIARFHDIDIYIQNTEDGTFLGRDHVLKFVRVVYWNDDEPMPLQYRRSRTVY